MPEMPPACLLWHRLTASQTLDVTPLCLQVCSLSKSVMGQYTFPRWTVGTRRKASRLSFGNEAISAINVAGTFTHAEVSAADSRAFRAAFSMSLRFATTRFPLVSGNAGYSMPSSLLSKSVMASRLLSILSIISLAVV